MSKVVEMLIGETVPDVVGRTVADVRDKKKKEYTPGKYVFVSPEGHVVKVATITGPGKTEQSYKEDLDINRLVEPAMRKGLLRHVERFVGEYDDIPVESFQDAQFIVAKGRNMFEALPSRIRTKFGTPDEFMKFVQDPANKDWLIRHGVVKGVDGLDRKGNPTGYDPANDPVPPPVDKPAAGG